LRQGVAQIKGVWAASEISSAAAGPELKMHREDLMRRDRLSEFILLGFAALLLASVALFVLRVAGA
jgi:hypothetical protein